MKIAVQASDLDHSRIDGTRVYLRELLKRFGALSRENNFHLYHARAFNPELAPPQLCNYREKQIAFPKAWMQTRFAWEIFRDRPEKLFLPIQAAPFLLPKNLEVTATIHDLAFKKFPGTFPRQMLFKLNLLLDMAITRADKLIAVSQSTKDDILRYYPKISPQKIKVIHHGFDAELFEKKIPKDEIACFLRTFNLQPSGYILYVGALQPRKNLVRLVEAFEAAKKASPDMKLVLVGEPAWLSQTILERVRASAQVNDIHLIGQVSFSDLCIWYQGARLFAFPSLYEGFGIPILEAFASGVPVLTANNSSLPEVAGDAALYVDANSTDDIAAKLMELWSNQSLRNDLVIKGQRRLKNFSWDKCAEETLEYILS